jgi:hypothetical protein
MSLEGILLTIIGFLIFMIGMVLIALGSRKKMMHKVLWKDEVVSYRPPQYIRSTGGQTEKIEFPKYMFSSQHPSKVRVEISSISGPYTLYLADYVGSDVSPESLSRPMIHHKDRGMPKEPFELELPPGSYCLSFLETTGMEAKFSMTIQYDIKPHEKWFDLGQTFLGVGVPILITGLVSLLFV